MVPADQLLVFSLSFRGQHRRRDSSVSTSTSTASAPVVPPPEPLISKEVTLQQLMDEVRTLSVSQTEFH